MALRKQTTYLGFSPDYWKIISSSCDYISNTTLVEVALYLNEEQRRSAEDFLGVNNIIDTKTFQIANVDLSITDAYAELKSLPDFSGAEDC